VAVAGAQVLHFEANISAPAPVAATIAGGPHAAIDGWHGG
jgi:hypothetical protein